MSPSTIPDTGAEDVQAPVDAHLADSSDVDSASPRADAAVDAALDADGCSGLPVCDGFEGDTPGMAPTNWSLVMGCNPTTQDTAADGGGLIIGIDSSQHHGGSRSVRVVGGDSCGYYFENTSAVATLNAGKQLYGRFWVMFSGPSTMGHNGFMVMPLGTTTNPPQLRLGFLQSVVTWNDSSTDSTLPDLAPQGIDTSVATAASTWNCMEFHVDEMTGHLEFWLNGTSVAGLSYNGTTTTGVNDTWATSGPPAPVVPASFGLGWLGLTNQYTVWFGTTSRSEGAASDATEPGRSSKGT